MISRRLNSLPPTELIGKKPAALFMAALLGICGSAGLSAAEQDSCVSMKIEVMEGTTCDKPSPGTWSWNNFLFGHDVQAYSTIVQNQCDQAVQIMLPVPGRAVDVYSYVRAAAHEPATVIGCGRREKPLGWCFVSELVDHKCPENLLRAVPE